MAEIRPPYGYAIYCDDIRHEVAGKHSLMGVYSGRMFIHRPFPVTLPRLGIAITYVEHKSTMGKEKVAFGIFLPGDADDTPTAQGEVPSDEILKATRQTFDADNPSLPPAEYAFAQLQVVFSPLLLRHEGIISVRIFRGDETIRLGSLRVEQAPQKAET